jgi:ribosomal protein S18 acetylase RimI-like enzyme/DNA-binding MarR family transcriptional regulator
MHKPFDNTGLGSRLRRLSQAMLADVDRAYVEAGLEFRARLFPVVFALHRDGPMRVSELTAFSGFTQPATSQTIRQLENNGYVKLAPGRDSRERKAALTAEGRKLVESLQPFWNRVRQAVDGMIAEAQPDFMAALASLEAALERKGLFDRIAAQTENPKPAVELVTFSIAHKDAFHDLNLEWLESHFHVEQYDQQQLRHPERILEKGGEIWFALIDGKAVGTGALYCKGDGEFEIAKMAVAPKLRGCGIGAKLMEKLIQRFIERGGRRLFLVTNSKLAPAIALYRRFGFVEFTPDTPPEYERANVFMEWHGDGR